MSEYEPRRWVCKNCGLVLGMVLRCSGPTGWVRRLAVFAHAVQANDIEITTDGSRSVSCNVGFVVILDRGTVRCSGCTVSRDWEVGEDALIELLSNRKKRSFGL